MLGCWLIYSLIRLASLLSLTNFVVLAWAWSWRSRFNYLLNQSGAMIIIPSGLEFFNMQKTKNKKKQKFLIYWLQNRVWLERTEKKVNVSLLVARKKKLMMIYDNDSSTSPSNVFFLFFQIFNLNMRGGSSYTQTIIFVCIFSGRVNVPVTARVNHTVTVPFFFHYTIPLGTSKKLNFHVIKKNIIFFFFFSFFEY